MEYEERVPDPAQALRRLLGAMIAIAALVPFLYRAVAGPVPSWSCDERAPAGTSSYFLHTQIVFVVAGAALAALLLVLSAQRSRLDGRVTAGPGNGTVIAVASAAVLTAVFFFQPELFALYFLAAALLASWAVGLGILVLAGITASRARKSGTIAPWFRWGQLLGWYLLAVAVPVSFVFTAPVGPFCLG